MNIYECIVASVCAVVIGMWGLVILAAKCGLIDENDGPKKAYKNNLKKVSGQDLMKAKTKAEKAVKKSLKGKDAATVKVEVRTQTEHKKRGRKPSRKGGHLD